MPLRILESPDPLSENSLSLETTTPHEPILIDSAAARLLTQELRQYCSGESVGRSFLIAGHRGAGKTTLVAKAFLEVWKDSQRSGRLRRPLFVALNGPSLFSTLQAVTQTGSDAPKPIKSEAQIVLEHIVLALHRAAAKEFALRYKRKAQQLLSTAAPDSATISPREKTELAELAAQFDVDLMECPSGAQLREYFLRLNRVTTQHLPYEGVLGQHWAPDGQQQGASELLALSSVCDAYKRVPGEYSREDKNRTEVQREAEIQLAKEGSSKDFLGPILSILSGGAAGAGAYAAGSGGLAVAVAGLVAAFGTAAVVKYSSKRTTAASRNENFIFDLSPATLDRVIPVLIRRLWDAGLAPIFVVDELDKVENLDERMDRVIRHLKKLVAESAFFCFLTDREYFEGVMRKSAQQAYCMEHTYYSRRLFIVFQAQDFADYLKRRIPDPTPDQTGRAGSTTAAAHLQKGAISHTRSCCIYPSDRQSDGRLGV